MNISKVTNPEAKIFLEQFLANRNINLEFYNRVPEYNLDYRMVDIPKRKSDSPRESIVHQIAADRQYLDAINSGELDFHIEYGDLQEAFKFSKEQLLEMLKKETERMIDILSDEENCKKHVKVPWSEEPENVVTMLYGLNSHEVLHTGWNLAIMDHLNIERIPELKQMWG